MREESNLLSHQLICQNCFVMNQPDMVNSSITMVSYEAKLSESVAWITTKKLKQNKESPYS